MIRTPRAPRRPAGALLLALLLPLLAGCSSKTYRLGFGVRPEAVAHVAIRGQRPAVQVENRGAEILSVVVEGRDERHADLLAPGERSPSRRLDGPVEVRVEVTGPRAGEARVVARYATGLVLDQVPRARP